MLGVLRRLLPPLSPAATTGPLPTAAFKHTHPQWKRPHQYGRPVVPTWRMSQGDDSRGDCENNDAAPNNDERGFTGDVNEQIERERWLRRISALRWVAGRLFRCNN